MRTNPVQNVEAFFADLQDGLQVCRLFDHVPGGFFFVKDRESRLIIVNQRMLALFGLSTVEEVHGKTGLDFFPASIAGPFLEDDQRVMTSGEPLLGVVELILAQSGEVRWMKTTKLPLMGKNGVVIGLAGFSVFLEEADRRLHPGGRLLPAIDYLQENFRNPVEISTLARLCRLSMSQFHRSFKQMFRQTPHRFMMRLRLQAACRLLQDSALSIAEVADDCGFPDQNYFSRQFRQIVGMTPSAYRRRFR
jgi:AraC-like DNA-binding protein